MDADLSQFSFNLATFTLDPEEGFIARVPAGLNSRELLFESLRRELQLPSYFGNNGTRYPNASETSIGLEIAGSLS
jgi:hypothetical protein